MKAHYTIEAVSKHNQELLRDIGTVQAVNIIPYNNSIMFNDLIILLLEVYSTYRLTKEDVINLTVRDMLDEFEVIYSLFPDFSFFNDNLEDNLTKYQNHILASFKQILLDIFNKHPNYKHIIYLGADSDYQSVKNLIIGYY